MVTPSSNTFLFGYEKPSLTCYRYTYEINLVFLPVLFSLYRSFSVLTWIKIEHDIVDKPVKADNNLLVRLK